MRHRTILDRHIEHLAAGGLDGLLHGLGDFNALPVTVPDLAPPVAHHNECGEAEPASAFDDASASPDLYDSLRIFFLVLLAATRQTFAISPRYPFTSDIGLVKEVGQTLFHEFLLPFEMSSALFISAMVGAVMFGKKDV